MLKIALGVCYYEDFEGIRRLFDSLKKTNAQLEKIFFIDGKYRQFNTEDQNILSSIKIYKFLEKQKNTVNFWNWPTFPTEIEKRNKYLELCTDDIDFLIVIDTDEYIQGDWSLFTSSLEKLKENIYKENWHEQMRNLHFIAMQDLPATRISNRPRLFYQPSLVRYHGCHYTWIHTQTKKPLIYTEAPAIEGIMIIHDATLRNKEYEQNMHLYQIEQKKIEDNNLIFTMPPK